MSRRIFHTGPQSALLPEAVPVYEDLRERGLLHRYVLHVRSSQAFALNLFAPLDDNGIQQVFHLLGTDATCTNPTVFEYADPHDRLAETTAGSRHQTQVDVMLSGNDEDGRRVAALVEVKFTEIDFGWCSGYLNPGNPARDVCCSPGIFGGQPKNCFQLNAHGRGRRRYDTYLADLPVRRPAPAADDGGCWLRRSRSQPMRNLALAETLLAHNEANHVIYALCAPHAHPTIWRRLTETGTVLPDTATRHIRGITAGAVAALHPDGGAAFAALYTPELAATA
jgi:hypothetical protein